jgi:hypothetical protein
MKKTILNFEATKDGENLFLRIKADQKLETFFKNLANGETRQSAKWQDNNGQGLSFYVSSSALEGVWQKMNNRFDDYYFDDFGANLKDNDNRINVALLRAAGISNGLTLNSTDFITYDELKNYIATLAEFTKKIYLNFINKTKIKARITFEI